MWYTRGPRGSVALRRAPTAATARRVPKSVGHSGAHGSGSDALSQIPSVLGAAARISPIHPDPQSRPHFLVLFYDLRSTQDYLGHRDPKHPLRKHEVQDMSRTLISSGSTFEKTAGYSRAVVQGAWCFVSGTTGYDYRSMQIPAGLEDQIANCFKTIRCGAGRGRFFARRCRARHVHSFRPRPGSPSAGVCWQLFPRHSSCGDDDDSRLDRRGDEDRDRTDGAAPKLTYPNPRPSGPRRAGNVSPSICHAGYKPN